MVARAVAEFGRLDVIVNNAGVTRYAPIMELTEADWDRIHRVNAKGVFFCLQRAAREMIAQHQADGSGGRIINIASISGRGYPGASNAAYAASKGAVIALTKTAAQQLGPHNINVNAICPGVTRTELGARNAVARAAERGITDRRVAGRAGRADPDRPRQHARGHRGDGGVPRLARRAQHHRPGLQRRRRAGAELKSRVAGFAGSRARGSSTRPIGRFRGTPPSGLPQLLSARLPFFYGWVVLGCLCCAGFSRQGGATATLSVFVEPLTREFGWSRTALLGGGVVGRRAGGACCRR